MTHSPEQRTKSPELRQQVTDIAQSVVQSERFKRARQQGQEFPDAYRTAAHTLSTDERAPYSRQDRSLVALTGELGAYIQAQHELNASYEETQYDPTRRDSSIEHALKTEHVIPFNHLLKDFINEHPNETLDSASKALTQGYSYIFSRYDCLPPALHRFSDQPSTKQVLESLTASLDGMRHEIAAETILEAADYLYEDAPAEDDARGIDMYVYLEGHEWTGVDIKASPAAVEHSKAKHKLSNAVWTGLGWEDFKGMSGKVAGGLSIPFDIAQDKASIFVDNLYEMADRNKLARQRMSRKTGQASAHSAQHRS